jgi:hypothetical protein
VGITTTTLKKGEIKMSIDVFHVKFNIAQNQYACAYWHRRDGQKVVHSLSVENGVPSWNTPEGRAGLEAWLNDGWPIVVVNDQQEAVRYLEDNGFKTPAGGAIEFGEYRWNGGRDR